MMANIGNIISETLDNAGEKYRIAIEAFQNCLDVVNQNRAELAPQTAQAAAIGGSYRPSSESAQSAADEDDDLSLDDLDEE